MQIRLLLCGGTIDATFIPSVYQFKYKNTHFHELISRARLNEIDLKVSKLFLKDSGDMIDADRQLVVTTCQECEENHILVAHGTDTLVLTAKTVAAKVSQGKTIVFFGSMLPFELQNSDALFNFGAAIMAVQQAKPGVYIAMNGKLWRHDEVQKDTKNSVFTTLSHN